EDCTTRSRRAVDKGGMRRAATQGFDSESSRPREQVEHTAVFDLGSEDVEHRFAHESGSWAQTVTSRFCQRHPPSGASRDPDASRCHYPPPAPGWRACTLMLTWLSKKKTPSLN